MIPVTSAMCSEAGLWSITWSQRVVTSGWASQKPRYSKKARALIGQLGECLNKSRRPEARRSWRFASSVSCCRDMRQWVWSEGALVKRAIVSGAPALSSASQAASEGVSILTLRRPYFSLRRKALMLGHLQRGGLLYFRESAT